MSRRIPNFDKLSRESQRLYDTVNTEDDLPCVLICVNFLNECLGSLLRSYFIKSSVPDEILDPNKGILGSYAARLNICYCSGLISKGLYQNLRTVGEIRNDVAHSYLSFSFEESQIAEQCAILKLPQVDNAIRYNGHTGDSEKFDDPFEQFTDPRSRFTIAVILIANDLIMNGLTTTHTPRASSYWD